MSHSKPNHEGGDDGDKEEDDDGGGKGGGEGQSDKVMGQTPGE